MKAELIKYCITSFFGSAIKIYTLYGYFMLKTYLKLINYILGGKNVY